MSGTTTNPVVQAAVRDSEPSVEVVLGRAAAEAHFETLTGVVVPLEDEPSPEETDALLSSTVRLPSWLTNAAGRYRDASWMGSSPMATQGRGHSSSTRVVEQNSEDAR